MMALEGSKPKWASPWLGHRDCVWDSMLVCVTYLEVLNLSTVHQIGKNPNWWP